MLKHLHRTLRREDGVALVIAVLVLAALLASGGIAIALGSASGRQSALSRSEVASHSLAEAGVAEALSVLHEAENPLNPTILGHAEETTTSTYSNGSVSWWGEVDPLTGIWTITALGSQANPTSPEADTVKDRVVATVRVESYNSTDAGTQAWNWIYSWQTGNVCDMTVENTIDIQTSVYVEGNLCVDNTAEIERPANLVVKGNLTLKNPQNSVGRAGAGRLDYVYVLGSCQYRNFPAHLPCSGAPDNVHAVNLVTDSVPSVFWPAPDFEAAYLHANPGPYYPCAYVEGSPPAFDNDAGSVASPDITRMNHSLNPATVNLVPSNSYVCRTAAGELSWNATTHKLTVRGTIFIDGNIIVHNGETNEYDGQAVIYSSGTILIKQSELCAIKGTGGHCNTEAGVWNPNNELLMFVARDEELGQVQDGVGIGLVSAEFQGALMAEYDINLDTTSSVDGPMLGNTVFVGQTSDTTFPNIQLVPSGSPGTPVIHTTIQRPLILG